MININISNKNKKFSQSNKSEVINIKFIFHFLYYIGKRILSNLQKRIINKS
jgi:hypothetical protein